MVGDDLLEDLGRRLLADLSRSSLMGALPVGPGPAKRSRMPKMAIAPSGEDFDQEAARYPQIDLRERNGCAAACTPGNDISPH